MKKFYSFLVILLIAVSCYSQVKTAVIQYTSDAPEIDGLIDDEWSVAPSQAINVNFRDETPTIGNSIWKALYDDENFYLVVFVDDENHWPSWESGGNRWEYDGPEIYWDWNDNLQDGVGAGTNYSGHYQLADGFFEDSYDIPITTTPFEVGNKNPGGTYAYSLTGEKYVYEMAVPFTNFYDVNGTQITKDIALAKTAVGFDVTIIDQDEGITTSRNRAYWNNAGEIDEAWNNMDGSGHITFAPQNGISKSNVKLGYKAESSDTVSVFATAAWNISSNQSWLTISPSSGTGNGRFSITASENTGETRTANLVFHLNGFPDKTIIVTQYGNGILYVTAGNLATVLGNQLATTTNLSLVGTIDALDFKTMRDDMPLLAQIDLSNVTITTYNGPEGTSNNGNSNYAANIIPEQAFRNSNSIANTTLSSIILPETVTEIGYEAFAYCMKLSNVVLPSSLRTINDNAFSNCNIITSVIIPNGVTSIGWSAFSNCNNLESVIFSTSLTEINPSAFSDCWKLKDINIPASVTSINHQAFYNCAGPFIVNGGNSKYSSLNGVLFDKNQTNIVQCPNSIIGEYTVPESVKTIGSSAFQNCYNLTSVIIPNGVNIIGDYSFYGCNNLSSVTIPEGITTLGNSCFSMCNKLTSINIPSTITTIGQNSFSGDVLISSIYSYATTPIDLSNIYSVFYDINKTTCTLYVPIGSKSAYQNAAQWQEFENIEERQGLFPSTTSLSFNPSAASTKIYVASSVNWYAESSESWLTINPSSAAGSDSMTITLTENTGYNRTATITIHPTGLAYQTITVTQFGIEQVTAGNLATLLGYRLSTTKSLTLIGTLDARDFKTMRDEMPLLAELDLEGVTILQYTGKDGTIIGTGNYYYPENEIPERAFMNSNDDGKATLVSVIMPESVTNVGYYAFRSCANLARVILPSSLRIIRDYAFQYCGKLTSLIIPNGVTSIGDRAFDNCTNLENVIFPASLTEIRNGAFQHCSSLKEINIPSSVTTIRDYAFRNCYGPFNVDGGNPNYSSLDGVLFNKNKTTLIQCPISLIGTYTVPSSVKTIGLQSINYCGRLKSVIIPEGVTTLGDQSFFVNDSLESISIPSTLTTIGNQAFAWNYSISSIYSYSATPANLSNSSSFFIGTDKTTCTLNVPFGSKSAYQNAVQWQDFTNIVEMQGLFPSTTSLSFNPNASTNTIHIASSVSWSAESSENWISLNPSSSGGSDSLHVTVTNNTGDIRSAIITIHPTGLPDQTITVNQKNEKKAIIEYTSEAPVIDGLIDDIWSLVTPLPIAVNFREERPTIGNSTWRALYDDDNFYLVVFVDDDNHWPSWETGGNLWEYDAPEIYWDWNDNLQDGVGAATDGSGHYMLSDGFIEDSYDTPITTTSPSIGSKNPGGTYAYSLIGEKYVYEYAIPLVNFYDKDGVQITKDIALAKNAIGFDVTIVDQDAGITTSRQRANWCNSGEIDEAWNNMDGAGKISLAPQNGVSKSKISFSYKAGSSDTINVVTNVAWNINSNLSWLTISPSSGTGNGRFIITASENSGETRTASLIFHLNGFPDKTITVTQYGVVQVTAGNLATILGDKLATTTNLTIVGTIDARDFKTMRDAMPLLAEIDLSRVTVSAYNGNAGTSYWGYTNYLANEIPQHAFINSNWIGKQTLVSVVFPATVTSIGSQAFNNCSNLAKVFLPTSLINISDEAFRFCNKLTTLFIPNNVTLIGSATFSDCHNLTSVFLPSSLREISDYAFDNCWKLKDINIPASVTSIRIQAFNNCAGPFIVDESNPNYSSLDGVLFDKNQITLLQCPNSKIGVYSIPSTIKTINTSAFAGCNNLLSVIIPEGVFSIGPYAFAGCEKLPSISIPSTVTTIGNYAFSNLNTLTSLYTATSTPVDLSNVNYVFDRINKTTCTLFVPYGSKAAYQNAVQWQDFQKIVEMQGLFPSTTSLSFNPSAAATNIFIASSVGWSAESSADWLSLNPSSSVESDSLLVSVTQNTGDVRTATITIHPTGLNDQTITVTQYGVVQVTTGNLATILGDKLATTTNLTLVGTIDARDFKTMRDAMPSLAKIDLSGVTIIAYNGSEGTINGTGNYSYPANEIPQHAFLNSNWEGKTSLVSVVFPATATSIGSYAFRRCTNLSNIILPSSLRSINYDAFSYCNKLISINIPNGVTYLSSSAFYSCNNLESVIIPNSLTEISNDAFGYCTKLKDINIPASVTVIRDRAFRSCAGPFIVDASNPNYSSLNGVLFDKNQITLLQYPISKTGEYTIPLSVKTIGIYAFYNCDNLTTVNIPEGVNTIREQAFYDCSNLASVTIPSTVSNIGSYAFASNNLMASIYANFSTPVDLSNVNGVFNGINKTTCTLYVPYGSKAAYQNAVQWQDFQNIVEMQGLFPSTTSLSFNIPASSKSIFIASSVGWSAESSADWLSINPSSSVRSDSLLVSVTQNSGDVRTATITIHPTGLNDLTITVTQYGVVQVTAGNLATILGDKLATSTSLTLVGTIDARDFKTMRDAMPSLAEIDLSGVTIVAYNGTEGTIQGDNYSYPANEVPQQAFLNSNWEGKTSLVSAVFPATATSIGSYAFRSCTNLSNIILPSSLRSINYGAFSYCNKLISINIPNGVTYLSNSVFSGCNNLESVILPNSITEIGYDAFGYCTKLKDINIPASVTVIRGNAFLNCEGPFIVDGSNPNYSSLDGVLFDKNQITLLQYPNSKTGEYIIPSSVKTIGILAFYNCDNLTTVNIPEGVNTIGEQAFYDCNNLTPITIPSTVLNIGYYAFAYNNSMASIYVSSSDPVDLSNVDGVFEGIDKTTCTLYVPHGSKSAYQNAVQWQDFENIVEMQGLFPSTTSLSFNPSAAATNIFIASSVGWNVESSSDWLSINPTSSEESDSLLVSVTQNTGDVRTATITIHPTGLNDQTITVTQYGVIQVTAGNLATVLGDQLGTTTSLTLVGTIDARDFKTMRDAMPSLAEIDLSGVTIIAYSGAEGTFNGTGSYFYPANEVPQQAFINNNWEGKTTLVSVVFPATATSIGTQAFYNCPNLSNIILPSSLRSINSEAFSYSEKLKDINIPASVTVIREEAFIDCAGPFIVNESNPNYSSLEGVLFDKNQVTLIQYPNSKTGGYTVPSSVKTIGIYAFYNCDNLTTVNIPEGVYTIGDEAFYDCSNLTSITIPATVSNIVRYAFAYSNSMASIYSNSSAPVDLTLINGVFNGINKNNCTLFVPYGSKAAYQNAVQWQDFTNIVEATSGFGVEVKTVLLPSIKSDTTINVIANVPWNVSSDQAWLSVSPLSGTNNGSFTISATSNTGYKRKATVTLSSTGYDNQVLYITQGSGLPYIILSDSMNISAPIVCDNYLQVITNNYNQFFRFIPEQSGNYTFYSESSSNPEAAVLNSSGSYLDGDNDSWTDWNFIFTCNLTAGEEYYFRLRNFDGNNKVIDLFITGGNLVCNQDGIPEDQQISSETLSENVDTCFNAYENITVAGDGTSVIFESGSSTRIIAGNSIRFLPGFHAQSGSWMDAHITTDSSFCDRPSASIVSLPAEKSVSDDFINQDNINPIITKSAKVYPNPNNGNFNIEFSNLQLGSDIHIYNMQGRLVHKETIQNTNLQQINIMGQKQGVYVLKIRDGKETINQKLIIY